MAGSAEEVYRAGLELDLDERTIVAHRLLASLHPADDLSHPDIDAAWREEISTRVDDILHGEVTLVDFEQMRARARARLDDLRK